MTDTTKLWQTVLTEIELSVSKANFLMWFKETYIQKVHEGVVYLGVPSTFIQEWLNKKFHNIILRVLRESDGQIRALEYVVVKDAEKRKEEPQKIAAQQMTSSLPLNDYYINKDDNLNPRYTFDNFIVGPFNELAFAAAQAIIKKPGTAYNPFFIYGSTGHGKTHLIQAIGNHIKETHPGKKVFYLTSEKFGSDYVSSLQANKILAFKEKYRKYDVLIIDDIQFFSNKEKSQEELFHLFNSLYEGNKQIIFSSDKHPNFIPNLEDRLRSRFGSGMIIDIPIPDHESRLQILQAKGKMNNLSIDNEVAQFLAANVEGSIRELEGVLNAIICQTQLKGRALSLLEVKNLIKNSSRPKKTASVKDVIKLVADFYKISEDSIYDKTRKKEVVKPRQVIMYILREDFSISYPSIGEKLGGRDHTTVIHSCEKVKEDIKVDSNLVQELSEIRAMMA